MNFYKIRQILEHISDMVVGTLVEREVKRSELEYGVNKDSRRQGKIILSMTTYNKRYETIGLTLKSLLLQTVKPDKIIVWLDEDIPKNEITEEMSMFKKYGIEYRNTYLDLKPHDKYFHAMKEFPDDIVITVDDDIVYPKDMIESLMKVHKMYPEAVCARRVHLMTYDKLGKLEKYNDWKYEYRKLRTPSYLLCATGVGGVLYPPHVLPQEAFQVENIKEYCHNADDIWLKVMEVKNRVKVVWVPNHLVLPKVEKKSQKYTLNKSNVVEHKNDEYIQILCQIYPEAFEFLYVETKILSKG